jgi:DHA2 family multidrug resistance protein
VFYINMPVGVAALIMIKAFVFDPSYIRRGEGRVDSWGIGLLAVSIGALQIVLDKGQQEDWFESRWITGLLIVSIVMLAVFLMRELTVEYPVLDLHIFKDRTFSTGTFLMTVLGFVLYGSLVLLPIWMQTLLGYSSLDSGIAMAPRGIGAFCGMPLVGLFLAKYDPRKFLGSGLLVAALTLWSFSRLDLNAGYWDFFWPQFIQGVSLALLFVPLTTISMSNIPREQMGNATSIFNLLRNIGGSIGIAGVATMTERFQQVHVNNLVSHITPYGAQSRQAMEGMKQLMQSHGAAASTAARQSYISMFGMVERQASILAYTNTFRLLAVMFLAMIPLILIMKKPGKPPSGPVVSH